jgi:hypothetical protein
MMWFRAHIETLPELQGEECFRDAEVLAVGTGHTKHPEKITRRWRGGQGSDRNPKTSKLAALGIKVNDGTR